jgi:hypothetical protein
MVVGGSRKDVGVRVGWYLYGCVSSGLRGLSAGKGTLTAAHAPRRSGRSRAPGTPGKQVALPPVCPAPRQGGSGRAPFSPGRPRHRPRRHAWAGAAGVGIQARACSMCLCARGVVRGRVWFWLVLVQVSGKKGRPRHPRTRGA